MTEKTDFQLIETFKSGDITGFNELIRRYQEKVYWLARRVAGTHEDADDITQDVFVRVFEGLRNFRGEANFFTWLYRITVNVSLNSLRKKRIRDFIPYDEIMEAVLPSGSKTDDHLLKEEYRTLLERAVRELPNKQRIVFAMRFHDELPFDKIAGILGKSVGGTKANYSQALKKVTAYIKREIDR